MAEDQYISPHDDITAAYNALLAIEDVDMKIHGDKEMKGRIIGNALKIIDKSLQAIAKEWEDAED